MFGVEGDQDYSSLSGSASACGALGRQTAENNLGTARLRAGYTWDRVLFYGTGGATFGNIKTTWNGSNSNNQFGWTAGAGIKFALAKNWTAKVEYLYVSLQIGSCSTGCPAPFPAGGASVTLNENLARVGANYKFSF